MPATTSISRVPANGIASQAAIGQGGTSGAITRIIPLVALFYAILVPQEVRIELGGQNFYTYRIVGFLVLPWVLTRLARGGLTPKPIDLLMFAGSGWMVVSFAAFYGFAEGFLRGGALAFDVLAPYLVARLAITNPTDLRRVLVLLAPGIFLSGLVILVESLSHQPIVRPIASSIFGARPVFENGIAVGVAQSGTEIRLGLMRAAGPFAHPILAGLLLSSAGAIYFSSGLRHWPWYLGIAAGLLAVFSLSSAAFLALILLIALTIYDRINRLVEFISWPMLAFAGTLALVIVHFASQNGIISIIIRFTLDPSTGYYRRLIWRYGTQSVSQNPLFGIGFNDYERASWMTNSIDAYWLSDAVRHGLITPVCLLLVTLLAILALSRSAMRQKLEVDRRLLVGLAIAIFVFACMGFTVSFFGGALTWFYALLGMAATLTATQNLPGQPSRA